MDQPAMRVSWLCNCRIWGAEYNFGLALGMVCNVKGMRAQAKVDLLDYLSFSEDTL